jgi:hypothetical protein
MAKSSKAQKTSVPTEEAHPKPRPKGEPEAMIKLRETIETQLAGMTESYEVDDNGSYVLPLQTCPAFVVPTWIPEGPSVVRIFAITNLGVPVTAELTSYLLTKNLDFVFGAFGVEVEDGAVWFVHNILGEYLDPQELEASLGAVATTADEYSQEIKDKFGGRLYKEAPDESLPTPPAPGYL